MDWWKKLDPKQRKLAIAAGAGGLLALVVVLMRGGSAPDESAPAAGAVEPEPGYVGASPADGGYPASFADNGAGFGQLTSAISEGLAGQNEVIAGLIDRVDAVPAAAAAAAAAAAQRPPGALAQTGHPAPVTVNVNTTPKPAPKPAPKPKPKQKLYHGHTLAWWKQQTRQHNGRKQWRWPNGWHSRPYAGR